MAAYPQRQQTPNALQIIGQGVQQVGQTVGDFQSNQERMRALFADMVEKKRIALAAQRKDEDERALREAKTKNEEAARKYISPYLARIGETPENVGADLAGLDLPEPVTTPMQVEDLTQQISQEYPTTGPTLAPVAVTAGSDSTALMGDALKREDKTRKSEPVYQDYEKVYRAALKHPDSDYAKSVISFIEPRLKAAEAEKAATASAARRQKGEPEALSRIVARFKDATKNGAISKQDMARIMVEEDPTGAIFASSAGKTILSANSSEEAIKAAELGINRFDWTKTNDLIDRSDKMAKNTSDLAGEIYLFKKLDGVIPGGIYGKGGVSGYGFGTNPLRKLWKTDEAKAIRPTLQILINKILKRDSGAAVSDQEWDRLQTAFGINTTGTIEEFRLGLQNYYEQAQSKYDLFRASDPEIAKMLDERISGSDGLPGSPFEKRDGPTPPPTPHRGKYKPVTSEIAGQYLKQAGGDKKEARRLLAKDGYNVND